MKHNYHFFVLDNIKEITSKEQIQQITKVLRLKANDNIVGIYNNQQYLLCIKEINKKSIQLNLQQEYREPNANELQQKINLYIPLLKGKKLDWALQKCTELGAYSFHILEYDFSVRNEINWSHQSERWSKIITEAVEQSERSNIPEIHPPKKLSEVLDSLSNDSLNISCIERLNNKSEIPKLIENKEINIFIGPEGGFSEAEKEALLNKTIPLHLGSRILRAETAIIHSTGIISQLID